MGSIFALVSLTNVVSAKATGTLRLSGLDKILESVRLDAILNQDGIATIHRSSETGPDFLTLLGCSAQV